MPKNNKAAGTRRENELKDILEKEGWVVVRSPGSLGAADLTALKYKRVPRLIQVKANAGSPWKSFGPAERDELWRTASKAGAVPELCHWPPHGEPRFYFKTEWPR